MTADGVADVAQALARRDILVAAWEEDAVSDVLRMLSAARGLSEAHSLQLMRAEAAQGNLQAYRYASASNDDETVGLLSAWPDTVGTDYRDAVYLTRTSATLDVILSLPPPPQGDTRWLIGLWGAAPHEGGGDS